MIFEVTITIFRQSNKINKSAHVSPVIKWYQNEKRAADVSKTINEYLSFMFMHDNECMAYNALRLDTDEPFIDFHILTNGTNNLKYYGYATISKV